MAGCLAGLLAGWLAGWQTGWLAGWLAGGLAGWLAGHGVLLRGITSQARGSLVKSRKDETNEKPPYILIYVSFLLFPPNARDTKYSAWILSASSNCHRPPQKRSEIDL
jgi:hypothetical protein